MNTKSKIIATASASILALAISTSSFASVYVPVIKVSCPDVKPFIAAALELNYPNVKVQGTDGSKFNVDATVCDVSSTGLTIVVDTNNK